MLNKITRTLKSYLSLLLSCLLLVSTSPWADARPPIEEQANNETVEIVTQAEVTELATEPKAEPTTDNKTDSKPQPAANKNEKQPVQSAPEQQAPAKIPDRGVNERPATQPTPQPESKPKPQPEPDQTASTIAKQQDLNTYVLNVINTYRGRSYPYLLDNNYATYNGVTSNIYYQGQLLLKAHPSGNRASHCVGITFEVFFKAMQARNKAAGLVPDNFNGMSTADMTDFMLKWYVAGPKAQNNLALAIERYGLGQRITNLSAAKAGDFIDFSRTNGTGHAAVLINWIRQDGEIIGLRYWSSQESTGGIAYVEEYFAGGNSYGRIRRDQVYIGRVGPIDRYKMP